MVLMMIFEMSRTLRGLQDAHALFLHSRSLKLGRLVVEEHLGPLAELEDLPHVQVVVEEVALPHVLQEAVEEVALPHVLQEMVEEGEHHHVL